MLSFGVQQSTATLLTPMKIVCIAPVTVIQKIPILAFKHKIWHLITNFGILNTNFGSKNDTLRRLYAKSNVVKIHKS